MAKTVQDLLAGLGGKRAHGSAAEVWELDAQTLSLTSLFGGELAGSARVTPVSRDELLFHEPPELAELGVLGVRHLERASELRAAVKDAHEQLRRKVQQDLFALDALGFGEALSPPAARARAAVSLGGYRVAVEVGKSGELNLVEVGGAAVPRDETSLGIVLEEATAEALKARIGECIGALQSSGALSPGRGAFDAETVRSPLSRADLEAARRSRAELAAAFPSADGFDDEDHALEVDLFGGDEGAAAGDRPLPLPDPRGVSDHEAVAIASALADDADDMDDGYDDLEPAFEVDDLGEGEGSSLVRQDEKPAVRAVADEDDEPTRVHAEMPLPPEAHRGGEADEADDFAAKNQGREATRTRLVDHGSSRAHERGSASSSEKGAVRRRPLAVGGESSESDSLEDLSEPEMVPIETVAADRRFRGAHFEKHEAIGEATQVPPEDDEQPTVMTAPIGGRIPGRDHQSSKPVPADPALPEAVRAGRAAPARSPLATRDARPDPAAHLGALAAVVGEGLSTGKTGAIQLDAEAFASLSHDDLAEVEALEREASRLEARARELRAQAQHLRQRHAAEQEPAPRRSLARRVAQQRQRPPDGPPAFAEGAVDDAEGQDALASASPAGGEAAVGPSEGSEEGVAFKEVQALLGAVDEPSPSEATQLQEVDFGALRGPGDDLGDVFEGAELHSWLPPEEPDSGATRVGPWDDLPEAASLDFEEASQDAFAYTSDADTRVGAPMPAAPEPSPSAEPSGPEARAPVTPRRLEIAIVVDDARARERLKRHLAPRFGAICDLGSLRDAAELDNLEALDAVVVVRPSLDAGVLESFERLVAHGRRPPILVLSSEPGFEAVHGVDLHLALARRVAEVAQQVIDGLDRLGIRVDA